MAKSKRGSVPTYRGDSIAPCGNPRSVASSSRSSSPCDRPAERSLPDRHMRLRAWRSGVYPRGWTWMSRRCSTPTPWSGSSPPHSHGVAPGRPIGRICEESGGSSPAVRRGSRLPRQFLVACSPLRTHQRSSPTSAGWPSSRRAGGVLVRVGPPRPRIVPVLASFEADLIELAKGPPERLLVGGTATSRHRASNLVAGLRWPPGSPSLSTRRLRSTWLAHHLTAGTRLPELARSAGLVGVAVLGDLLEFVPPLGDRDAVRQLRGVVS